MAEKLDDRPVRARLAVGQRGHESLLQLLARQARVRVRDLAMRERIGEQFHDDLRALAEPSIPLVAENRHRSRELRLPALLDAGERFEQFEPVGESGMVRVKFADRVEVQPEPPLPVLHMIVGACPVDDREPRLAGEPEDFHLGRMDFEQRLGTVHHVDDPGPADHRLKEQPLRLERVIAAVPRDELAKQRQRIGRMSRWSQLRQRLNGILKTRRVVENEQVVQRETLTLHGLAGLRTDPHLIVFRERGHDGRLAVIDRAHNRESRRRVRHVALHFSTLSRSP